MTEYPEFQLAAIQACSALFDRDASTDKACMLIEEAGQKEADLSAFEHSGDSCIIDLAGEVIAGPAKREAILVASGNLEFVLAAKSASKSQ